MKSNKFDIDGGIIIKDKCQNDVRINKVEDYDFFIAIRNEACFDDTGCNLEEISARQDTDMPCVPIYNAKMYPKNICTLNGSEIIDPFCDCNFKETEEISVVKNCSGLVENDCDMAIFCDWNGLGLRNYIMLNFIILPLFAATYVYKLKSITEPFFWKEMCEISRNCCF